MRGKHSTDQEMNSKGSHTERAENKDFQDTEFRDPGGISDALEIGIVATYVLGMA